MTPSIAETMRKCGLTPSVAQSAFCKSILGEELNAVELEIYRECTGRADYAGTPVAEGDGIIGRKGGKTECLAAPLIVHRAATSAALGETHLIVSPSKSDQARIAWNAVNRQLQRGFPGLVAEVKEAEGKIFLHTGNVIAIASANFRSLRGPKYATAVLDEACFFYSDDPQDGGANPLPYILDSIVGGMIVAASPLLLLLSTPWNKSGVMFEHFRDRAATLDRLVWRADTLTMNPHANRELMERHRKDRGENFYRREYLAEFSEDSFAFIEAADVDAAIAPTMPCFPPAREHHYVMGLDPGRLRDHFGCAIAHREGDVIICDWCTEWKPGLFGLKYSDVLPQVFQKAREYRIRKIFSDQIDFGGIEASIPLRDGTPEFTMERIMTGGAAGAELSDVTRALFAQRKLLLPNQPGLGDEFKRLTNFLSQGGTRDVRARRGFDDRSRAVMLAVHQAFNAPAMLDLDSFNQFVPLRGEPLDAPEPSDEERRARELEWERRCFDRRRSSLLR